MILDFKGRADAIQSLLVNGNQVVPNFNDEDEHIVIEARFLRKGHNIIRIEFIAGELALNRKQDFLYCLFVPAKARTVFPCFDQPDLKANWNLTLRIPKEWAAVANARILDSQIIGSSKLLHFRKSDRFSSYLFSFVAGDFKTATDRSSRLPMTFYYRESDPKKKQSIDSAFDIHIRSVRFLEEYTKVLYPFQKLDFTAIPDFQYGGMEHVGAIDYKERTIFLGQGATSSEMLARRNVIGHEVSHMWFGDLVTMKWFDDVWLKEVFANFMADKVTGQGGSKYELNFLLSHLPYAYDVDRTKGANAIHQQLENLNLGWAMYGGIIYHKAPVMMRQLELLIGKKTLQEGLSVYLNKYRFGNASWQDLITILDDAWQGDLDSWNKAWVNTAGRPVIGFRLKHQNGRVVKLTVTQSGEFDSSYMLTQQFDVALIYPDTAISYRVNMNSQSVEIIAARRHQVRSYVLLNSTGIGYGLFSIDENQLSHSLPTDPIARASAYINLYENMLCGKLLSPSKLIGTFLNAAKTESEDLSLNYLTSTCGSIFWRFLKPETRKQMAPVIETELWSMFTSAKDSSGRKRMLFRAYQNVSLTQEAVSRLYSIWKNREGVGIVLSERDYVEMALNLALKGHQDLSILTTQLARTENPDLKESLRRKMPALSPDETERDKFFASLSARANRKPETVVIDALWYLHHPLRAETSIKYLPKTLEMFEEVQRTGDIFFPYDWLFNSLSMYQRPRAKEIVNGFISAHKDYNQKFTNTIKQASDLMFRAVDIAE